MHLHRIQVKNFRLLKDIELFLESDTTLVVGRNNSGKTSLSEIIRRFTSDKSTGFLLQDFSSASYEDFCNALRTYNEGKEDRKIRSVLPFIELRLFIQYDPGQSQLGSLGDFVIDLDMECNEALVVMRYELKDGAINDLFQGQPKDKLTVETRNQFFRDLRERIPKLFTINVWAEDPNDPYNKKASSKDAVRALLKSNFITAHRGLDDVTTRESNVLAKILEALFNTASLGTADESEQGIATNLRDAVKGIQDQIDSDFTTLLKSLIPTLASFGYPGLGGSELTTETTLDVERLLTNHTKVRYVGHSGITLPESYNGLGMRNLICILLQIVSFYRSFRAEPHAPGVHLVFIEEPEAHLHPQMQEVFIRQITSIVDQLNEEQGNQTSWPVQFVVSTHSSHIANEAGFAGIRYFLPTTDSDPNIWQTKVKDLRKGLADTNSEHKKFLHQYLTLTRCDLFFADKAILIEGTSERLLLPVMTRKMDETQPEGSRLGSQYVTVMEVGGAYAHIFFDLLDFLELQSLIITDLDPVEKPGGSRCIVRQSTSTSNACITHWFGKEDCAPLELIKRPDNDKLKGLKRISYQRPEDGEEACGRTFEDTFMLANPDRFGITGKNTTEKETDARDKAEKEKKSGFALRFAIDETDWKTPLYILEGLRWLAAGCAVPPNSSASVPKRTAAEVAGEGEVPPNG